MLKNSIKNQYKVKEKKNTTLSFHLQNTRQHTYNLRTIRYTVLGKLNRPCRTHSCIHLYINTYIHTIYGNKNLYYRNWYEMHILSNVKLYLEDKWEKKKRTNEKRWRWQRFLAEKKNIRRRIKQNLLGGLMNEFLGKFLHQLRSLFSELFAKCWSGGERWGLA